MKLLTLVMSVLLPAQSDVVFASTDLVVAMRADDVGAVRAALAAGSEPTSH